MSHLGSNQRRILQLLTEHAELTALELAELVYEKEIEYSQYRTSTEYSSVLRSLHLLEKRGLVKRIGGRIKWRKAQ